MIECIFSKNIALDDNIRLVLEVLPGYTYTGDYLVYEQSSMQKCSKYVLVESLNLYDGMTLLLF